MRGRLLSIAALVIAAGSLAAVGVGRADGAARPPVRLATPRELIYVANADSGPVTAYPAGSRGAVKAVRRVLAPPDPNAEWDPWGVTFDASGHLFVQSFLSDATTVVFRRGAHGTTTPERKFDGISPDDRSVAVDSHGYEYVSGSEQPTMVVMLAPGAHGKPGDLYSVPAVRTIQLDEQWNPWPSDLAIGPANDLLAVTARPQGNAVEVFTGGPHGGATPVRVISGTRTGLGSCGSVCDLVIAFSPRTGRIYVAVSDGSRSRIIEFAGRAAGNVRPVATIEGSATRLAGTAVTGITVSQCGGTIYAMAHAANMDFTPARVDAYARLARGDARPVRSFTDHRSRFTDAEGLTITGCSTR